MVVWLSPLVSACRGESWEFATRNLEINPQPSILRVRCKSISSRHAVFQSLLMPACPSVLCCLTLLPVLGGSVLIGAAVHHDSLQSCTVQSQSGVHWVAGWLRPVEVAVWPDFSQRGGHLASRLHLSYLLTAGIVRSSQWFCCPLYVWSYVWIPTFSYILHLQVDK